MISRRAALALVFMGVVYAVTLIATIPAPWLSRAIENKSRNALVLREPVGTAWRGHGILFARLHSGELLELGQLRWNVSASRIFVGRVSAEIGFGAEGRTSHVVLAPSGLYLRDLNIELPARILTEFAPALRSFGPQGRLLLRSDSLRFEDNSILGLADIEWRQARLVGANGLNLGSHVAHLRGGGSKVDIEFESLGGPLRLSGGGSWSRDTGLEASGTAEHDPAHAGTLGRFLQGVCSEYRTGRCSFRFKERQAAPG